MIPVPGLHLEHGATEDLKGLYTLPLPLLEMVQNTRVVFMVSIAVEGHHDHANSVSEV